MSHVTDSFSNFSRTSGSTIETSEKGYSARKDTQRSRLRQRPRKDGRSRIMIMVSVVPTIDPVARSCRRSGYRRPASDARNPHDGALDLTIGVLPRFPFRPADRPDWTRIRGAKVHIANSSNCPKSLPTDGSFLTRSDKGPGKIGQCWIRG